MKKHIMWIFMALALMLAGCGGSARETADTAAESAASSAETVSETADSAVAEEDAEDVSAADTDGIRFTMMFVDPETSPYVQGAMHMAELVEEATDGRIGIDVVPDSTYGELDMVSMAMDNELDIATCANSVLTNYIPQMNILDQAYLWKNAEEAHAAVDGTLGELIRTEAEGLGLHVIGFEESGFRNTFSTKPIDSMDDFQGVTIRTMENKYHQAAFEAFGAEPVALPYTEVFEKLENGEINACENATANCLNSGYYQITKHVTNTQHAFVYIVLCMSDDAWNRIPEDLREPFLNAVQEGVAWERAKLVEANAEAVDQLEERGVTFHEIDVAALQDAYRKIAEEKEFFFDDTWQAAVEEAIESVSE